MEQGHNSANKLLFNIGDEIPFEKLEPGMLLRRTDTAGSTWFLEVIRVHKRPDNGRVVSVSTSLRKPGSSEIIEFEEKESRNFDYRKYYFQGYR